MQTHLGRTIEEEGMMFLGVVLTEEHFNGNIVEFFLSKRYQKY